MNKTNSGRATHTDIRRLYLALKEHEPLLTTIDKSTDLLVFSADYETTEEGLVATLRAYTYIAVDYKETLSTTHIKAGSDWMSKQRLWFRKTKNGYEAFIDYIDEYRDHFMVDIEKPCISFRVKI